MGLGWFWGDLEPIWGTLGWVWGTLGLARLSWCPAPCPCVQRVLLVPEPCTLDIDGVIFGLTSTDLLFHMGAEEISRCPF